MKVIRLMGDCDSRCIFCMVENEMSVSTHQSLNTIIENINSFPEGTSFDLFGGEPTLFPHFKELLKYLKENGIHYQIASNCRSFADKKFTRFVKSMQPDRVRTSLYGSNPRTHDILTRSKGSWQETIDGIHNLVADDIPCIVNYVIFRNNLDELLPATRALYDIGVRSFKYSLPIFTSRFLPLLANITNVREVLSETIDFIQSNHRTKFEIEKAPFCIAPMHLRYFNMESDEGMINQISSLYAKPDSCNYCDLHHYCNGVEVGYLERFGEVGINPVKLDELSSDSILWMTTDELLQFEPNLPFTLVCVSDSEKCSNFDFMISYMAKVANLREHGKLLGIV